MIDLKINDTESKRNTQYQIELQRLKMGDMFTYHFLLLTHRVVIANKPLYLLNTHIIHGGINYRTLRHNNLFDIPFHHTQLHKRSFLAQETKFRDTELTQKSV